MEDEERGLPNAIRSWLGIVAAAAATVAVFGDPGWQAWQWLTPEAAALVPLVGITVVLVAGHAVAALARRSSPVVMALEVLSLASLAALMAQTLRLFPMDFSQSWAQWDGPVRLVLVVGLFCVIMWLLLRSLDLVQLLRRADSSGVAPGRTRGRPGRVDSSSPPTVRS